MNPAARVALATLLSEGSLERVPVDADVCRNLMRQAGNHLVTAAGGVEGDPEGAFALSYDACRKACLALVMAMGLRSKGESEHRITFEAAAAISESFGCRAVVNDAADLRHVRHGAEYRAETISLSDARDAIDIGRELVEALVPNVERILAASLR
jgi:hypothetical protein